MHQIISYMHVEEAQIGGFIYPLATDDNDIRISYMGTLRGLGGKVYKIAIPIPQLCNSFKEFATKMNIIEESLEKHILAIAEQ